MRQFSLALITASTVLALAACGDRKPRDETRAEPPASAKDTAETGVKSSIIRPEVEEEENIAPREPLNTSISFADNGTELSAEARSALDEVIASSQARAGGAIVLRGNTDSAGNDDVNLRISERRANMVRDYMVENGIEAARIRVIALGEMRPVAPNATLDGAPDEAGRAKNRRVDITIALPGENSDAAAEEGDKADGEAEAAAQ